MTKEQEFYQNTWQGGHKFEEGEFARGWDAAVRYINKHTFEAADEADSRVMKCACAIVDCLEKYAGSAPPGLASESADGYSAAFRGSSDLMKEKNAEIEELCRLYLPKELLYKGLA